MRHPIMILGLVVVGAAVAFAYPHGLRVPAPASRTASRRASTLRCQQDQDGYEAKNPLITLLGGLLEPKEATADDLADIVWDAPKVRGLSTEDMAARLDAGLRGREWFVTGRGLPELFGAGRR